MEEVEYPKVFDLMQIKYVSTIPPPHPNTHTKKIKTNQCHIDKKENYM